jgi:hypothetical protein
MRTECAGERLGQPVEHLHWRMKPQPSPYLWNSVGKTGHLSGRRRIPREFWGFDDPLVMTTPNDGWPAGKKMLENRLSEGSSPGATLRGGPGSLYSATLMRTTSRPVKIGFTENGILGNALDGYALERASLGEKVR